MDKSEQDLSTPKPLHTIMLLVYTDNTCIHSTYTGSDYSGGNYSCSTKSGGACMLWGKEKLEVKYLKPTCSFASITTNRMSLNIYSRYNLVLTFSNLTGMPYVV